MMCNYENIQENFLDDELYENLHGSFFELCLNIVTTRDSSFINFNIVLLNLIHSLHVSNYFIF